MIAARKLAATFRAARKRLGASQEEVAHAAGLAVPTYSALERGETATGETANPTLDTVMRAAFALGLDLPEFPVTLEPDATGGGDPART
jgi:transcriptional regulator with XRE-family HTH domain